MGSSDSVKIADMVGIYILNILGRIIDRKQVCLYRDDGCIFIPDIKKIIRTFKLLDLKIEISSKLKIVISLTLHLF